MPDNSGYVVFLAGENNTPQIKQDIESMVVKQGVGSEHRYGAVIGSSPDWKKSSGQQMQINWDNNIVESNQKIANSPEITAGKEVKLAQSNEVNRSRGLRM